MLKKVPIENNKIITNKFNGILNKFIIVPLFSLGRKSDLILEYAGYKIPTDISYKIKENKFQL